MYHLLIKGVQTGPLSFVQVKALWHEGSVNLETLYWQDGMAEWMPLSTLPGMAAGQSLPRIISGFWRRVAAYLLDALVLGLPVFFAGLVLFDVFTGFGPWGLLIGYVIALLYFGLLNSAAGKGRTVGKRLMGIEVVDRSGNHISPGRSFLRYFVLSLAFYINALIGNLGLSADSPWAMPIGVVVFFIGLPIIYLIVFNLRNRQSLHDLAVGTYVVRSSPAGPVEAPPVWKGHFVILAVCLVGILAAGLGIKAFLGSSFSTMLVLQKALLELDEVRTDSVNEGINWNSSNGNTQKRTALTVSVMLKKRPDDEDAEEKRIATLVLARYPRVMQDDRLVVTLAYGYNLGIASSHVTKSVAHTPEEWKQLTATSPST